MGENGADVILSSSALKKFPYAIEAKSRRTGFTPVYQAYEQALSHQKTHGGEPLVVIKQDRQKPLAIIDLQYFIKLQGRLNGRKYK